jgi:hypothetical protein
MHNLVVLVIATLGASIGGEIPREWVSTYQAFHDAAASLEDAWNGNGSAGRISWGSYVSPYMQWAVPNSVLSGDCPLPPIPPFPSFDPPPQSGDVIPPSPPVPESPRSSPPAPDR